jgi:Fe-Mn family superoxide dismutase
MLTIYGFHMNLRQLEEIGFWKRQEKEHTSVIRTLFPTLEAPYVQQLESWKTVFEQTETAATQWMNWAVQSQQYSDTNLHQQSRAIVTASRAQSQQFIRQLEEMKRSSPSIRSSLHVQLIIDHIIRESQYFIAILEPFDKHIPSSRTSANQTSIEPKQALHMDIPSSGETSWSSVVTQCQSLPIGGHQLPPLPYVYDALEPYIDKKPWKFIMVSIIKVMWMVSIKRNLC